MRFLTTTIAALTFATGFAAPTFATTIADGQTFCESLNVNLGGFSAADCDLGGNRDLANTVALADAANDITFQGSGTILGFVLDAAGQSLNFPDYANVVLETAGDVTFTLFNSDAGFDTRFSFGDMSFNLNANESVTFSSLAGTFAFGVVPTDPNNSETAVATDYSLTIAAVPLPASSLLLLGGLGGLGLARRRKNKKA